ncbi:MAG: DUF882 domain-containing protein [Firmicutes bacterium]|nr:DUF882 domain-containing protein [Bacillota bacterium]
MSVKTYSRVKDGELRLSRDFQVKEFACKDGTDKVLIDTDLAAGLQKIREYFHKPVIINSAYRTAAHNKRVGGSANSQHLLGKAADIRIEGVSPLLVAQYAEYTGMGGIGLYGTFTHVDTRAGKARWDQRSGGQKAVSGFGGQGRFAAQSPDYIAVQRRYGFDGNTMAYLAAYTYGEALLHKLAAAK